MTPKYFSPQPEEQTDRIDPVRERMAGKEKRYERVLCPHCGRLLGRRSAAATGFFQLKCPRCSHEQQRTILVDFIFLVEIDEKDKVD